MLAIAGDPSLAEPLAEDLAPLLVAHSRDGLIGGLPPAMSRHRWRRVGALVLVAGIRESLDMRSSDREASAMYRRVYGRPPPQEFRMFDPDLLRAALGAIGEILSEYGGRPRVLVVPAVHCLPGPMGITPAINRILRAWCAAEGFGMLPDRVFSCARRADLFADPLRGLPSAKWAEVVVSEVSRWLDGIGE